MGYQGRDIEVIFEGDLCIAVACDSCGAVGQKQLDAVRVSNPVVGELTARVALLELIAAGITPRLVAVSLCTEPNPTGNAILAGVRRQLREAGLEHLPLTVSSEKNFTTDQTGLGIAVTGVCKKRDLRIMKTEPGDSIYCLGLPLIGPELTGPTSDRCVSIGDVRRVSALTGIHDIIPIGSRGILGELQSLAAVTGYQPRIGSPDIDLKKSAGPSSCVVLTCGGRPDLNALSCPVAQIGVIR